MLLWETDGPGSLAIWRLAFLCLSVPGGLRWKRGIYSSPPIHQGYSSSFIISSHCEGRDAGLRLTYDISSHDIRCLFITINM